jgi:hypothetical protein
MLPEIDQLLVIQDRDQKIKTHQSELNSVPLEKQRVEQTLRHRIDAFDQIKLRAKEIEVQRKKLELDANSRRDTIAKYKIQQSQTRKNDEFQAIGQLIARHRRRRDYPDGAGGSCEPRGPASGDGIKGKPRSGGTTFGRARQETRDIGATASGNRH